MLHHQVDYDDAYANTSAKPAWILVHDRLNFQLLKDLR